MRGDLGELIFLDLILDMDSVDVVLIGGLELVVREEGLKLWIWV